MARTGITITRSGFAPLFPLVQSRILDLRPIGPQLAAAMRTGGVGSVQDHFDSQRQYLARGGFVPWTPSLRALRTGTKTLIDTGAYEAAWVGRGPGSIRNSDRRRTRVGVRASRFPQITVFQADSPTRTGRNLAATVVPRPIGMNPHMMERISATILRYIATGKA